MTDIKRKSGLFPQMDGLSLQSPLRFLSVLVICLLLTKYCKGQSQLMGSPQPIVATVGDNIILPCHLEPAVDVAAMTLEWTRPDLKSTFAFVWRAEKEVVKTISPSYKGRTSLFTDELERGNISLKLSDVRPSDAGRYKCYIPDMLKGSFIELVVGAVSLPVITSVEIDRDKRGVVLQCESAGWYPEPEVLWLDSEGNLLSAGPTETVRGPDDLYTVSSRVTVEKRHSNSFICRVQQRNINQTRETHIQVPADFLMVQAPSSNDTTGLAVGLTVGLAVCIAVILILLFFVWKLRQNQNETNRGFPDENKSEESRRLMPVQTISRDSEEDENKYKNLEDKLAKTTNQLQDEEQKRKAAEKEVENLRTELKDVKQANDRCKEELEETQTKLEKRNAEIRDLKKEVDKFKRQPRRKDAGKPPIPEKKLMNKNREEEEKKKGGEEAQNDDATFETLEDLESKHKDEQETEGGAEKESETQAKVGTSEERVSKPEKPETECETSEEKLEATTDSKEQ